jgi:putative phosphoesterase
VGLIADTHGLLRPEAQAFLEGSKRIVHAGDIGDSRILKALRAVAAVSAVRGNNDTEPWAARLPESRLLTIGLVRIYVIHIRANLGKPPAGVHVVITGHSHTPVLEMRDGVLFVNPGSAGPRRFKLPVAAGELRIQGRTIRARVVDLTTGRALADLTAAAAR